MFVNSGQVVFTNRQKSGKILGNTVLSRITFTERNSAMRRIKIADKVHISFLPSDKFKTNFLSVNFITELTSQNATGTALLSRVLTRASKNYPTTALLSQKLQYYYDMTQSISSYKRGEKLIVSYTSDFLKNAYLPEKDEDLVSASVEMFREVFFNVLANNGAFDETIVKTEKNDLVNTIRALINNKNAYARQKCTEIMCENERYSISENGTEENALAMDVKGLYDFYQKLISTSAVEIFFVGECDEDFLEKKFADIFASLDRNVLSIRDTEILSQASEEIKEVTECMQVSQGKIAMGFRTGVSVKDSDSAALFLMCDIFGGSPVSKLFMNVREKLSLCYYCRSIADSQKGVMFVLSGIESANRDKAMNAILSELSDIQNGNITDEDLDAAKLSLTNSCRELDDNPAAYCSWILSRLVCGIETTPEEFCKELDKVTISDVVEVSKKIKLDSVYFLKGNDASSKEG